MSYLNDHMGFAKARFVLLSFLYFLLPTPLWAVEFYEKPEIQKRMEDKREVISVVKISDHPQKKKWELLTMDAAGILYGVTIPQALKLMADYNNLERIAPDYIKLSELIIHPHKDGLPQKYIHMKTQVKNILVTYSVEVYAKVREEESAEKGVIHWEIIPASMLGRKLAKENFVGLKGQVSVTKYNRGTASSQSSGRGVYRRRPKENPLLVQFRGTMEGNNISKIIPNFMMQIAMEVALQRVGVLLRKYLETSKISSESQGVPDI